MGRVVAIIQARMGSSRLPGKSMMDLAGKPLIQRVLETPDVITGNRVHLQPVADGVGFWQQSRGNCMDDQGVVNVDQESFALVTR